jgi:hypothetical protein
LSRQKGRRRSAPHRKGRRSRCSLSFDYTFNPYSSRCPVYDKADAPRMRARVLRRCSITQSNARSTPFGLAGTLAIAASAHGSRIDRRSSYPSACSPMGRSGC